MKRICCFLLLLGLLSGCRERADVIPMDKMESLLYDMYALDAYLEYDDEVRASADSLSVYLPLIEKYGYDRDMFEKSMRYYIGHDDEISEIIKEVRERMRNRVSELDAAMNVEEPVKMREIDDPVDSTEGKKGRIRRNNPSRRVIENTLDKEADKKIIEGREKEEGGEV